MIVIQESQLSNPDICTYIQGEEWRFEYFFAFDVKDIELNSLLEKGWRKFGAYYFKPGCDNCKKCIPIRVLTRDFVPSKSQKRIMKKGGNIEVKFGPLRYTDEIYEIYRDHSENRFNNETDKDDFISTFYTKSCPSIQSEYYLDSELIAVGFLDQSNESLSSIYFVFRTAYEKYKLGSYSIIKEIEHAAKLNLKYYYLGYFIEENKSMSYKNRFHPYEQYSWNEQKWIREEVSFS